MQPENTGDLQEKRDGKGRFRKGVSGNPEGKPRGSISIVARIKEELGKAPNGQKTTYLEALVKQIFRKAILEGDVAMIRLMLAYVDGLPLQPIDLAKEQKIEGVEVTVVDSKYGAIGVRYEKELEAAGDDPELRAEIVERLHKEIREALEERKDLPEEGG